ncbi:MAG: acyl-CoA thioesterase [Ruminococcus sp.]|nr:acyl-CoA thioesterase [Ruminococcus sp.]
MGYFKPYRRKAYYYETDRMDIVHHSNYVRWLEEARVDLMAQAGSPFEVIESMGVVSPVLSVTTEYKYPVKFGDEFEVRSKITEFNGCKFSLSYEIFNLTTNKLSCLASSKHCFTDNDLRPIRLQKKLPELYENLMRAYREDNN